MAINETLNNVSVRAVHHVIDTATDYGQDQENHPNRHRRHAVHFGLFRRGAFGTFALMRCGQRWRRAFFHHFWNRRFFAVPSSSWGWYFFYCLGCRNCVQVSPLGAGLTSRLRFFLRGCNLRGCCDLGSRSLHLMHLRLYWCLRRCRSCGWCLQSWLRSCWGCLRSCSCVRGRYRIEISPFIARCCRSLHWCLRSRSGNCWGGLGLHLGLSMG